MSLHGDLLRQARQSHTRQGYKGELFMTRIFDRITVNPRQCGGRSCVRGMRIRVSEVLELLAEGMRAEQIVEEHPDLELEDIWACLRFANQRVSTPILADTGLGPARSLLGKV